MSDASASPRILCVGECLIDLIVDDGTGLATASRFAIREGGAPMNVAAALARLDVPAGVAGVVGDDAFGTRLRCLLDARGVDTGAVRMTTEAPTSIAYAWRDERGDGQFQLIRMADALLSPSDVDAANVRAAMAIVVGSVALAASPSREAVMHAVAIARRHDVPVVVDVNVRRRLWSSQQELISVCAPVLAAATVVKVSMDDVDHLWGLRDADEALAAVESVTGAVVVITDGDRGVTFRDPASGEIAQLPVFPVAAVDPTGAGDAFTAALLSRLVASGWTELARDDLTFAMAAGALTTTTQGAVSALPARVDVERFLAVRAAHG